MSFESVQKQVNLEIFDPAQFDRSLSFSDEASMTQKSYQSTETEKEMVNDLGKIDRLIGNIENQLKFKELILKSALNTPQRDPNQKFSSPQVRNFVVPKTESPSPEVIRLEKMTQVSDQRKDPSSPSESSPSVTVSQEFARKPAPDFAEPQQKRSKPKPRVRRQSLNIPFPTIFKIHRVIKEFEKLQNEEEEAEEHHKKNKSNPNPQELTASDVRATEKLQSIINRANEVISDLEGANKNHDFIKETKKFQKLIVEQVKAQNSKDPAINHKRLKDLEDTFQALLNKFKNLNPESTRISYSKGPSSAPKESPEEYFKKLDSSNIKEKLRKLKERARANTPKKTVKIDKGEGEEVAVVEDTEKMIRNKVADFLKLFSGQLKNTGLEAAEVVSQEALHLRDNILNKVYPPNEMQGLLGALDAGIEECYGVPQGYKEDEQLPNQKSSDELAQEFCDLIRCFSNLGPLTLKEVVKLCRKPETKVDVLREKAKLVKKGYLDDEDNPNLMTFAEKTPSKLRANRILRKLARDILPPPIVKTENNQEVETFEVKLIDGNFEGLPDDSFEMTAPNFMSTESKVEDLEEMDYPQMMIMGSVEPSPQIIDSGNDDMPDLEIGSESEVEVVHYRSQGLSHDDVLQYETVDDSQAGEGGFGDGEKEYGRNPYAVEYEDVLDEGDDGEDIEPMIRDVQILGKQAEGVHKEVEGSAKEDGLADPEKINYLLKIAHLINSYRTYEKEMPWIIEAYKEALKPPKKKDLSPKGIENGAGGEGGLGTDSFEVNESLISAKQQQGLLANMGFQSLISSGGEEVGTPDLQNIGQDPIGDGGLGGQRAPTGGNPYMQNQPGILIEGVKTSEKNNKQQDHLTTPGKNPYFGSSQEPKSSGGKLREASNPGASSSLDSFHQQPNPDEDSFELERQAQTIPVPGMGTQAVEGFKTSYRASSRARSSSRDPQSSQKKSKEPENDIRRVFKVKENYPILTSEMNVLRSSLASLVHKILKSKPMHPDNNQTAKPEIQRIREDLINLREALNTLPSEITVSGLPGEKLPQREEDLDSECQNLHDNIEKFQEQLGVTEAEIDDEDLKQELKKQQEMDVLDLPDKSRIQKSLLNEAKRLLSAVEKADELEIEFEKEKEENPQLLVNSPEAEWMMEEREKYQIDYEVNRDKLEDMLNKMTVKAFLEQKPNLSKVSNRVQEGLDEVLIVNQDDEKKLQFKENLGKFIKILETSKFKEKNLAGLDGAGSGVPVIQINPPKFMSNEEKLKKLGTRIVQCLRQMEPIAEKTGDDDMCGQISKLITEASSHPIPKSHLIGDLKEFCRFAFFFAEACRKNAYLNSEDVETFKDLGDRISRLVDDVIIFRVEGFNKDIKLAAELLKRCQQELNFELSRDPGTTNLVVQNLPKLGPGVFKKLNGDLEALNDAVLDCAHYLQQGLEEKTVDLGTHLEAIKFSGDPIQEVVNLAEKDAEILDVLENHELDVQEMFARLIEFIRGLEKAYQTLVDCEPEEISDSDFDKLDHDVNTLKSLKMGILDMNDRLSEEVKNMIANANKVLDKFTENDRNEESFDGGIEGLETVKAAMVRKSRRRQDHSRGDFNSNDDSSESKYSYKEFSETSSLDGHSRKNLFNTLLKRTHIKPKKTEEEEKEHIELRLEREKDVMKKAKHAGKGGLKPRRRTNRKSRSPSPSLKVLENGQNQGGGQDPNLTKKADLIGLEGDVIDEDSFENEEQEEDPEESPSHKSDYTMKDASFYVPVEEVKKGLTISSIMRIVQKIKTKKKDNKERKRGSSFVGKLLYGLRKDNKPNSRNDSKGNSKKRERSKKQRKKKDKNSSPTGGKLGGFEKAKRFDLMSDSDSEIDGDDYYQSRYGGDGGGPGVLKHNETRSEDSESPIIEYFEDEEDGVDSSFYFKVADEDDEDKASDEGLQAVVDQVEDNIKAKKQASGEAEEPSKKESKGQNETKAPIKKEFIFRRTVKKVPRAKKRRERKKDPQDEYEDAEVIIAQEFEPTNEYDHGLLLYKKQIKRVPRIPEIKVSQITPIPLKYFVNIQPPGRKNTAGGLTNGSLSSERNQLGVPPKSKNRQISSRNNNIQAPSGGPSDRLQPASPNQGPKNQPQGQNQPKNVFSLPLTIPSNRSRSVSPELSPLFQMRLYSETVGNLREYEPNVPPKYSRYVLLKNDDDSNKSRSIAIIKLGEKSQSNPLVKALKNEKQKSVPVLIQQPGSINGKPVLDLCYLEKLFAHKNTGLSPHAIMELKKDPFNRSVTRKELRRLLDTMNLSVPMFYYEERGDDLNGVRVVVPRSLAKLVKFNKKLSPEVKKKMSELDKERKRAKEGQTYRRVGVDSLGKPVYEQLDEKSGRIDNISEIENKDSRSSFMTMRIDRESSKAYLTNRSMERGDSAVKQPRVESIDSSKSGDRSARDLKDNDLDDGLDDWADDVERRGGAGDDDLMIFGEDGENFGKSKKAGRRGARDSRPPIGNRESSRSSKRGRKMPENGDGGFSEAMKLEDAAGPIEDTRTGKREFDRYGDPVEGNGLTVGARDNNKLPESTKNRKPRRMMQEELEREKSRPRRRRRRPQDSRESPVKTRSPENQDKPKNRKRPRYDPNQPKTANLFPVRPGSSRRDYSSQGRDPSSNRRDRESSRPRLGDMGSGNLIYYTQDDDGTGRSRVRRPRIDYFLDKSNKGVIGINDLDEDRDDLDGAEQDRRMRGSPSDQLDDDKDQFMELLDANEDLGSGGEGVVRQELPPPLPSQRSEDIKRALAFRRNLDKCESLDEMIGAFNGYIDEHKQDQSFETIVDLRFQDLKDRVGEVTETFFDYEFPAGPSSMVNNTRKTTQPYVDLGWKKLSEIYPNVQLTKDFLPNQLFNPESSFPQSLAVVLSSLCQWPNRVKRLFANKTKPESDLYMVKLFIKGEWTPVLIDDQVPIKSRETLQPFLLEPGLHAEGVDLSQTLQTGENEQMSSGSGSRGTQTPGSKKGTKKLEQVDIWPQLIAKAIAKAHLNYERMLSLGMEHFMRLVTGMPVKSYPTQKMDFSILRTCFKRQHVVIARAEKSQILVDFVNRTCELNGATDELVMNWIINHAIELDDGSQWVELIHPFCEKRQIKDWPAKYDLMISEDWRIHRKYRRCDEKSLWLTFEELQSLFSTFTVCRYQDSMTSRTSKFQLEGSGAFGLSLAVKQKSSLFLEVLQEDKVFCPQDYQYSKIRLFVLKDKEFVLGVGKQHSLVKTTLNPNGSKSTFCEIRLGKGNYKLVADVQKKGGEELSGGEAPRNFQFVIYSTKMSYELGPLQERGVDAILMETLSNLAIQRGSVQALNQERSLRRYVFSSAKIGICVFTYANRSSKTYIVLDRLQVDGDFICSKNLENGKVRITLPSKSKKFLVFRYGNQVPFKVEILESSSCVRTK